jgi:hypothetical protein
MVRTAENGGGNPWGDNGERTTVQSFFPDSLSLQNNLKM